MTPLERKWLVIVTIYVVANALIDTVDFCFKLIEYVGSH